MADFIADHGFNSTPIYVTDLERCQPPDRLSLDGGICRWQTISYEAEGFSGIYAKGRSRDPRTRDPLPIEHDRLACNLHRGTPNQRGGTAASTCQAEWR